MSISVYDCTHDEVIKSTFVVGKSDYNFAIENLTPLIGRFDEQRKKQSTKFYARLKQDIISGCVMPPITLAFVSPEFSTNVNVNQISNYINDNISTGYILDGMQRLNTLQSASQEEGFEGGRPIFINVIVASKYDFLLYRMITLNNGQKPMTPRHQIEILTQNLLAFREFGNIVIQTEKETEKKLVKGAFKLVDVAAAYTAFLTNNAHNQNNKIIDEKMNEILVGRVMSSDIGSAKSEFSDILDLVDKFSENPKAKTWLKIQNNLIGFTLGVRSAFDHLQNMSADDFSDQLDKFEDAFDVINPSKVNVGRFRRDLSREFFTNFDDLKDQSSDDVAELFVDITTTD
jgi:hypothetical protein